MRFFSLSVGLVLWCMLCDSRRGMGRVVDWDAGIGTLWDQNTYRYTEAKEEHRSIAPYALLSRKPNKRKAKEEQKKKKYPYQKLRPRPVS